MKRRAVLEMIDRKHATIAGMWANPNFDSGDDKEIRTRAIRDLDDRTNEAVLRIYGTEVEVEIDPDDPFFRRPPEPPEWYQAPVPESVIPIPDVIETREQGGR